MPKSVKCPKCGQSFLREEEEFVHVKNRYWHKKCYDEIGLAQQDLEELKQYICYLFEIEYVVPNIMRQINKYKKDFGYTDKGVYKALYYFFEVLGNKTSTHGLTIGIVPYVYDKAQKYFEMIESAKNKNVDAVVKNLKLEIKIPSPVAKTRGMKTIDIDALEELVHG